MSTLYMRTVKALTRLYICADCAASHDHSLLDDAISTVFCFTGRNVNSVILSQNKIEKILVTPCFTTFWISLDKSKALNHA